MTLPDRASSPIDTELDHVVMNVLRRMDEAEALFAALGFQLTPRGHHSLGSINHLIMTPGAYLELVGVTGDGLQRRDVLDSPFGLNGLVMHSTDADVSHLELIRAGLPAQQPDSFSRPVAIDGRTDHARFRTVRFPANTFPAVRIYHCQHLTPELVWRPEWFEHPNGFVGIETVTFASPDPARDARRYAAACRALAECVDDDWVIRLGDVAVKVVRSGAPRFHDIGLRFKSLDLLEAYARATGGAAYTRLKPHEAELTLPDFDLRLRCRGME